VGDLEAFNQRGHGPPNECWKTKSVIDSIVRIAAAGFLGALVIYWYFEEWFDYRWVAGW
jgi:hypothetical protein